MIQPAKGSDFGSTFGGGPGQSLFGSSGGKTVLEKITTVTAVLFMVTSLLLATIPRSAGTSELQKKLKEDASKMPAIPLPSYPTGSPSPSQPGSLPEAAPSSSLPAVPGNEAVKTENKASAPSAGSEAVNIEKKDAVAPAPAPVQPPQKPETKNAEKQPEKK